MPLSLSFFRPIPNPAYTLSHDAAKSSSDRLRGSVRVKSSGKEQQLNGEGELPKLKIGSPIIVTEAPKMIKTAASVPCLRVNSGLINPGDVGRIVSRKPMDVWAVRLSIGTYLIDSKYFKPLETDNNE